MTSSSHRSRCLSIPLNIAVRNATDKGQGRLPRWFTVAYKRSLGRTPAIYTQQGEFFQLRLLLGSDAGIIVKGWDSFVQTCQLRDNSKILLTYHGGSDFVFNESYQRRDHTTHQTPTPVNNDAPESPAQVDGTTKFCEISLTSYGTSKNHQILPCSFVVNHVNKELKEAILEVEEGVSWKCGLYFNQSRPKEARLSTGWMQFCTDAHLKVGDKIKLVVVDSRRNHWLAVIQRR